MDDDFGSLSKSTMHLLAFIKQMPNSSDQSIKDSLADMPDALSLFDMQFEACSSASWST